MSTSTFWKRREACTDGPLKISREYMLPRSWPLMVVVELKCMSSKMLATGYVASKFVPFFLVVCWDTCHKLEGKATDTNLILVVNSICRYMLITQMVSSGFLHLLSKESSQGGKIRRYHFWYRVNLQFQDRNSSILFDISIIYGPYVSISNHNFMYIIIWYLVITLDLD